MIQLDQRGRAFTTSQQEARKFRVQDRQINFHAIINGYIPPVKYVNFTTFDRTTGRYYLPPSQGKGPGVTIGSLIVRSGFTFQPHQVEALTHITDQLGAGARSTMIVSGTASGKSWMILGVINLIKQKTVIVVPTLLIGKGIYDKINSFVDVKMMTAQKYRKAKEKPDVLILSGSSFNNIYDSIQEDKYSIFITDEGHHLSSKRKDQMNLWKGDFIAAFTATPERKEYGPESFKMYFGTIYDTQKQSLPVHVIEYDYDYNYNIEEIMKSQEGLSPDSPEFYRRLYSINDDRTIKLDLIIKELIIQKGFKKIIVFVDRRAHVEQIKRLIPFAIPLTGDTNIDEFNAEIKNLDSYLIVAVEQCAGEGFDLPALECGILFVSSSWVNTIDQTAGRMRRYFDGKEKAFYVDFQDTITFMGGKKKHLGIYERRKIYKDKGWTTQNYEDFIGLEF